MSIVSASFSLRLNSVQLFKPCRGLSGFIRIQHFRLRVFFHLRQKALKAVTPSYCRISRQTIADRIRIDALCYHSAVRRTGFEQRLNLGLIAGIKLEWFGPLQHLRPQTTQWVF